MRRSSGEGEGEIVSLFPLLCSVFCTLVCVHPVPHTHTHTHTSKKKNSCTMHTADGSSTTCTAHTSHLLFSILNTIKICCSLAKDGPLF